MDSFGERSIERLQKNLAVLRKLAGWSGNDLADMLGVSRQTILSLETKDDYKMSKIQYIAIRALLDEKAKEDETLARVIHVLLDQEDTPEELQEEIQFVTTDTITNLGPRAGSVAGAEAALKALSIGITGLVSGAAMGMGALPGAAAGVAALAASPWIKDIIKKEKETKNEC